MLVTERMKTSPSQGTVLNESFPQFTQFIVEEFKDQYLKTDVQQHQRRNDVCIEPECCTQFPRLFLASWDCKLFNQENCPKAWAGQFQGKEKDATIVLEEICNPDLYVWYYFFWEPGSLNDLNILDKSSIVVAMVALSFDFNSPDPYRVGQTW